MKHLKYLTTILFVTMFASCATSEVIDEIEEVTIITPKNIEIIFTTSQLEFDEITVSYYDFDLAEWIYGPMQFSYDADGNPEPIIISLPNYSYDTVKGDAYRKNTLESSLKVQIYVDEILSFETESVGTALEWAHVKFDFTIEE